MERIILVGFMGVGKTTIGKKLSKQLKIPFIDSDKYIEQVLNDSIVHIFEEHGEDFFRKKEYEVLQTQTKHPIIMSTGGGIVTYEDSFHWLKEHDTVIYLKGSIDLLYHRIQNSRGRKRPLAEKKTINELNDLYMSRQHLYKEVADITIFVDNKPMFVIVKDIIRELNKFNKKKNRQQHKR